MLAAEATDLLGQVGLADRKGHYPAQLSGGEQQRVALARAFVNRPALLFADEPTGNLDEETSERVIALILDLNARAGTALVMVTHNLELAARTGRIDPPARRGDGGGRRINIVAMSFSRYARPMPMTVAELAAEALSLPSEARALLAEQLVVSLDVSAPTSHLDELWAAEAQRRLAEVRAGRTRTISGEEAAARVRRAVGR